METLSEFTLITKPSQQFMIIQPDISPYKITPLTRREKVLHVLETIGLVALTLVGIALAAVAVWGMIKYPPLIIFLFLGFLFGAINR
jgi:hypothetical protein